MPENIFIKLTKTTAVITLVMMQLFSFSQSATKAKIAYLKISECQENCKERAGIKSQTFEHGTWTVKFWIVMNCCGNDTFTVVRSNDTLVMRAACLPRLHPPDKHGRRGIVSCECDCFFEVDLQVKRLKKAPSYFVVNGYIDRKNIGFVDLKTGSKNSGESIYIIQE